MRTFLLFLFTFSSLLPFGYSQYHSSVLSDKSGQELLDLLVSDYKAANVLSYADARDEMYTDIDNVANDVVCIYTDHRVFLDPNDPAPREAVFMNGMANGINAEHSYPRSKGAENGNARSDIHHLYPSRVIVNTVRSNKPYAEIIDSQTDDWFLEDQSQSNIPSTNIDAYSESDSDFFEPRESVKGNIARSIMYFYTMYKSEADAQDPQFFWDQIETLCDWHYEDPVDETEWNRTFKIADLQDDKANPFVLDCSVAGRTYCDMISDLCQTVPTNELDLAEELELYPNPSAEVIIFAFANVKANVNIEIYSSYGQLIESHLHANAQEIILHHQLTAGIYSCKIQFEGHTLYKQFVVNK